MKPTPLHLTLASRSPRRRELLESAGALCDIRPSEIDDGLLTKGVCTPREWVVALAYLKATATSRMPALEVGTLVIGADTVCVNAGEILGQPRDAADAARMIRLMAGTTHEVLTGVAIVCPRTRQRLAFPDCSLVTVGCLTEAQIDEYIATGLWRGKAGAYNISERLEAGWPIDFVGTMDSIMGLPVERVLSAAANWFSS